MSYVDASVLRTRRPLLSRSAPVLRVPERDGPAAGEEIDLRQLRHHTKNALQRIIGVIGEARGLCASPEGERLVRDLEHRIAQSAAVSDALFGLTGAPGPMQDRLRRLAGAVVELMRGADQSIRVGVSVKGCCPAPLRGTVLRTAHELLGNAVKHGMRGRPVGRISVRLHSDNEATVLTVTDNGWGFDGEAMDGEGLTVARALAEAAGGTLELDGTDGTTATLTLPH